MKTRYEKSEELEKKILEKEEKRKKRKEAIKKMFVILLCIFVVCFIYARFIEPSIILINEHKITTKKISDVNNGLKILHFSDLHYGSTINKDNISKVIKKINFLNPDIVVFTGDLIEEGIKLENDELKDLTAYLSDIKAKLGKYACIGNHDVSNTNFTNVLYDANFKILINDYDLIYNKDNTPIVIYGVDNVTFGKPSIEKINEIKKDYFKVLLVHEPDYLIDNNTPFDLALTGHSHNGQINIPYLKKLYLPVGSKKYYNGHYKINETDLYVSNGLGSSGVNLRFASIPSINLFRITNK